MERFFLTVLFIILFDTYALSQVHQDDHYKFGITSERLGTVELVKYIDVEKNFSDEERSNYESIFGKPYNETYFADKVIYDNTTSSSGVKSVIIPYIAIIKGKKYKVTCIAENALRELTKVEYVEVPSSVDSIKASAFYGCSSMNTIKLGKSVKYLLGSAFSQCSNLSKIEVDEKNKYFKTVDNVLYGKDGSTLVYVPLTKNGEFVVPAHVRHIGQSAFSSSTFKSIVISEGVQTIDEEAFGWCKSLSSVTLPSTLRSIGKNAFIWSGIKSLRLPDGIVDIGDYAFSRSKNLQSVTFGSSLRAIGKEAFSHCALTEVSLPASLFSIGENAFQINPLRRIDVDTGNKYYCSKDGVLFNNHLDTLILYPLAKARSYTVPEGVTTIKKCAFDFEFLEQYDILSQLTLPATLKTIEEFAFVSCQRLREIELPFGINHIGECGLYSSALEAVVVKGPIPDLERDVVKNSTIIYVQEDYLSRALQKYPGYRIKSLSEKESSNYSSLEKMTHLPLGSIIIQKSLWTISEKDVKDSLLQIGAKSVTIGKEHIYEKLMPYRYKDERLDLSFAVKKAKLIFDSNSQLRSMEYEIYTNRNFGDLTESVANQLIDMGFRLVKGDYGVMVSNRSTIITIIPDPTSEIVFITLFDKTNPNNKKDLDEMNELIDLL